MSRIISGLTAALLLWGAAPALAGEKAPTVRTDPYTRTTTVTGQLHLHNKLLDANKWSYWLSADIVDGVARNPVLMFSTDTPEWFFFDTAADIDGNPLPVVKGNRDVHPGGVHELFGVVLTPGYIADHRQGGFNIKIMGSRGERVILVPAEVVTRFEAGWLAEVEKVGGFRNDLAAAHAALAPTADQMVQAARDGAAGAAARGGYGIAFVTLPQGIILASIAPGSRAERGGLRPGQLVTAINGKTIAGMSQADVQALLKAATATTAFTVAGLGDLHVEP